MKHADIIVILFICKHKVPSQENVLELVITDTIYCTEYSKVLVYSCEAYYYISWFKNASK